MGLSKEELLKPRYKVIADYPGSHFSVGAIMVFIKDFMHRTDGTIESTTHSDVYKSGNAIIRSEAYVDGIDKYPHLFRKLEWHEDRQEKDLPEYVKGVDWPYKGRIYKILDPSQNGREFHRDYEIEHRTFHHWPGSFLPATLEEYNEYLNSHPK